MLFGTLFEYAVQMSRYFEYAVQKSVARFWGMGGVKKSFLGQLAAVKNYL